MIFDTHTHIYPTRPAVWPEPSSLEALIASMDDAGVAMAAVVSIAPFIPVAVATTAAAAYPARLVAIGSVDPRARNAIQSLEEQVTTMGVRGIKLHPRLQRIGIEQIDLVIPIARRCGELGVPLIICSLSGGAQPFRQRVPELCHDLALASPSTAIVVAHACGHRPLDALLMLEATPNVHVDLSFSPLFFSGSSVVQDLALLVRKADPQRVMFGSDFPEVAMRGSVEWIRSLTAALGLPEAHRENILHANARRLFKVETPAA